tara:strand:+ start:413 stop:1261 length:849 start_codon:yes stop_codon:yes gene_type:complete
MSKFDSENFSLFSNYNCYLKHPPTVSISTNRIFVINEIYNVIKLWKQEELNIIPDSKVYLHYKNSDFKEKYLKKACMAEECIHRLALFEPKDIDGDDYYQLYSCYYKFSFNYLNKMKLKQVINFIKPVKLNKSKHLLELCSIAHDGLVFLLNNTPEDVSSKTNLELHYTKMSIADELFLNGTNDSKSCIRTTKQLNVLNDLAKKFRSYTYRYPTIHNGETLESSYKCMICSDDCTEYADCMYSNCRHMCVCYSCSKKLSPIDKVKCIVCRQHNDCLIQVFKP